MILIKISLLLACVVSGLQINVPRVQYVCLPCGSGCDKVVYSKPGFCPECHLRLVDRSTITFSNTSAADVCRYIESHPGILLLDVRSPEEFAGATDNFGTLKNAMNIPINDLGSHLKSIAGWKNKNILVYCSHSHRSPRAAYLLSQNGFKHVTNLDGGMSAVSDKSCIVQR